MTLHQLAIFAAVAKHRNITKASEALHITQPSVSRQLKLLEDHCNVKLYKKVARGIELTERGKLFLEDTEPILLQIQRLKEKLKSTPAEREAGFLTIGGSHSQSVSFLPSLITTFKENHPRIEVTLRTDRSRVIEQMLLDSQLEIGLITNSSGATCLNYEPCRQEKIVFFVSTHHPMAKKKDPTLGDIFATPLAFRVDREGQVGNIERTLKQLRKGEIGPTGALRCESPSAVKTVVKTGMGVGILYESDYLGDDTRPNGTAGSLKILKIPKLKLHVNTYIAYPKNKPLSPLAQEFLALLRQWPRYGNGLGPARRSA